jgi:hypothetical protein
MDEGKGVCQFVNKGLVSANYIFFLVSVLAFGSRNGQDVSVHGCMCVLIFRCWCNTCTI